MEERYRAAMVLGAVGDAMGYCNGSWEFCYSGPAIHEEVKRLGGVARLKISCPQFMVSDDTVLHLATAEGLVSNWNGDWNTLLVNIAECYKRRGAQDMGGRAPGPTTMNALMRLRPKLPGGLEIPFNPRGGGCGGAMRSAPIGLAFPRPDQQDKLIAASIETGRMTHNHPTGFLGSMATALFVSYAVQGKPPREWGAGLMETLPKAWKYVEKIGRHVKDYRSNWDYFESNWKEYLKIRGILDGRSEPKFPEKYNVEERDRFYRSVSFGKRWGGASGHDAPMIAYDGILGAGHSWVELCNWAVLHGGDNDSTGIIACAAWGAMYGFTGVPKLNYESVEYKDKLEKLADKLLVVSQPVAHNSTTGEEELPAAGQDTPRQDTQDGPEVQTTGQDTELP